MCERVREKRKRGRNPGKGGEKGDGQMGRKISWEENSIMDGENGRGLYWRCVSARCGDMRRRRAFRVPWGEGAGVFFHALASALGKKGTAEERKGGEGGGAQPTGGENYAFPQINLFFQK